MDPAQLAHLVQQILAGMNELAPIARALAPVVGQFGSDALVRGVRTMSGIDQQLKELAAQQRANAEADRTTLERVQGLEVMVRQLVDHVRTADAQRAVTGTRLLAVEQSVSNLAAAVAAQHANGGGQ